MNKCLKIFIILALSLCIIGCGKSQVSEIDAIIQKNINKTIISGEFTVCVRDVIPDYCLDDVTPCVALVTEFQSYPFTIYVGEEIGSQLEIGNQYVFSIEPVEVNYSVEELEKRNLSSLVWEIDEFKITGFRLAKEEELGLGSLQLTCTEVTY